jgi:energy-coupling factor transporter transmembrane protein EcfT
MVRLPASLVACGMVVLFYHARFFAVMIRFLVIWLCFYIGVGAGRYFAGTELRSLILDGAAGLALAMGVACSLLLVVTGRPTDILSGLDRFKVPREVSYALLSLLRLLPQVRTLGARQLALLELKGIGGGGISQRFRAYRRILGPLLVILLNQQSTHARSLAIRGFFDSRRLGSRREAVVGLRGAILISLLVLNAIFWYGVSLWN